MKNIITTITIATLLICSLPACKKSSDTQVPQTILQKIQAKWQLQTYYENDHYSGADHIYNTAGTSSDYFDFRKDMKLYYSIQNNSDTATYNLSGDTNLLLAGSYLFDIRSLTPNEFIFHTKTTSGSSDFDETTITLKK